MNEEVEMKQLGGSSGNWNLGDIASSKTTGINSVDTAIIRRFDC